jgi:hypothetical protein
VKRGLALVSIGVLVSCRFGGPSANPDDYVAFDAGADAAPADAQGSQDDSAVTPTDADASVGVGDDASPGDATPLDEASDASTPDGVVEGGSCAAAVAVCDPVRDTGCNPLQQCDVDMTQTSTPTGICVFNSGGSEGGGACIMTFVSESCPPRDTCANGVCRALCFCNADCPIGQCCSDTSGPRGFTLCGTCP